MPNPELEGLYVTCDTKEDFDHFDSRNLWTVIYERLKNQAALLSGHASCDAARELQNRWKNRYRDISPYDDTRVLLDSSYDGDYINASYVCVDEAPTKKYILTQGPMQQTVSHFWLMIWERRSPAIIMLNRIFEKGIMRCYPYFPQEGGPSCLNFTDVNLRVRLEGEITTQLFTKRVLQLIHVETGERHQLIHMHYTSWPDFGVPNSPSGMLNFLWAVRATDALSDAEHPAVVHCSAGVGRSGTFVLIDLALHLVETRGTMKGLDLSQLFVKLRRCRMGVIQTADQLRFCYSAVIQGSEALLRTPTDEIPYIKFEPQPDENDQSAGSSDSDDVWDGLEDGENGSSSEEGFDQVEDAEDLVQDVEEVCEESPLREAVLLERTPLGAPDSTTTPEFYNRHTVSPRTNHAWLYTSPEHGTLRNNTPVRVGPREPSLSFGVWNDRLSPIVGSDRYSDHLGIGGRFRRPELIDHSNNALPDITMDDEPEVPVRHVIPESPVAAYPQIASVSYSSPSLSTGSTTSNDVSSKPDGDGSSKLRGTENQVTEPPETDVQMQDVEVDPLTSEYLATAYALQRRRDVRRQRQVRVQEQMEQVQLLMRESNLERKRWIPVNISRRLRRFFAESGIVQSTQGAALSSAAVLLLAVGFALAGYHYYFGAI
ncbi:hypothetical protein CRM22_006791 [Opisthorchis felineus]|uniref:protein-tyrosine-phosphatase n=1 Tax=Opisthorchis felineus TaxID=147828 RepID=A0A4S2LJ70_OPIFE|nr:hypothetical protein CRM22_006791 [Opisthorchis felineus]TGZ63642.1 hypothetical protein CRM22_006791 [Opisthorchis felineus]